MVQNLKIVYSREFTPKRERSTVGNFQDKTPLFIPKCLSTTEREARDGLFKLLSDDLRNLLQKLVS